MAQHLHVGHLADPKKLTISTFVEKEKRQYNAIGTVNMFIETSANHNC